ncbi:MAG: proline iminopeptidase-family hydrolase [Lachnospiraceae bacterium]|nr:proline iminopeptidase-family hydrolase [Lachnospiraceae bacterium]
MKRTEGYIPYGSYKIWYRIVGECENGKLPLLILHGGPGMAHDYLESLEALAEDGRAVIFYDQLGCGKSPVPEGAIDWNTEIWEKEIDVVREALQLKELHILGQSWGGMLAMQYAAHKPGGLKGMVISSSPASMALWEKEAHRLIELLPEKEKKQILEAEATGIYDTPEYQEALELYYARHMCRILPNPEEVERSNAQVGEVYMVMEGPSEFTVTGKLKEWDITDQLSTIEQETLLLSGTDDEATPLIVKEIYDRIPHCEWKLLDGTHLVHVERKAEYQEYVRNFLNRLEK